MISVGSNSTGGTGYLTRIIKEAQKPKVIDVVVECGEHQDKIYKTIKQQLRLLKNVATLDFEVNLTKKENE